MSTITLLGCGSSVGAPWITGDWRNLKKKARNIRTRCCAHIRHKDFSILIDTSPDIKNQCIQNNVRTLDAVLYTHAHADQSSGIFELRPFFWKNKKEIPIYGSSKTINDLKKSHRYCFVAKQGYLPIVKGKIKKKTFKIEKNKKKFHINIFDVYHGLIMASGYRFKNVAYISDCNDIPNKSLKYLKDLNILIIDCLRFKKHPSHFNYDDSINLINKIKPKKSILTNLHADIDYYKLKKKLPKNVHLAYDGLRLNF